ncbi:MAG: hypothetical protein PHV93_03980 [Candidatus Pacebacteria bacterium]|nr:hypothetical protein [Candidatus Paceibacterota bacterium]
MDPEIKTLLEKNLALSQENNSLLQKMNRRAKWGTATRVVYWVIILGITFGSFYYLQPYINQVISLYSKASSTLNSFSGLGR